jgi:hypothetical protein
VVRQTHENRARYEEALARAHRSLWVAAQTAERQGWDGAFDDITQILVEVTRLTNDSLSKKGPAKVMKGQLALRAYHKDDTPF